MPTVAAARHGVGFPARKNAIPLRPMVAWFTLVALLVSALALVRIPRSLLRGYRQSFAERHGVGVQLGLTVLATVTLSMLWATLLRPGISPVMEQVDAAVVALLLLAGGYDLYLFSRTRSSTRPPRGPTSLN